MSHLGEYLSALVDGELTGAELDRANAHLAACEQCRAEATALRDLKRQLRGLATAAGIESFQTPTRGLDESLTERLLATAGPGGRRPGGQQASRKLRRGAGWPRPAFRKGRRLRLRPRGWHLIWGAVSLAVVGIGAAAFSMGGAAATPGPKVTPQVEMFSVEHAITSGDVPIPDSTTQVTTAEPKP